MPPYFEYIKRMLVSVLKELFIQIGQLQTIAWPILEIRFLQSISTLRQADDILRIREYRRLSGAPLHSPRAHSSVLNSSSLDVTPLNVLNRMLSEKLSASAPRSWTERYAPTPNPDFDDTLQSVKRYIFGRFTD
ncbi:MAG: hypothetical protein VYC82_05950 [Verrucomicrobiota bacterium]|nr:hypothetical protein [Verrucomicrobiota bacterium]